MLDEDEEQEYLELLEEEERAQARSSHISFMEYCWMKNDPFIPGFHTRAICERIDRAFEDFRNGKCTYLKINVHHRSGKSDILSRYTPPHFLGEFPDCEVMSVSFKAALTEKFTAFARNIVRSHRYAQLYPSVGLSKESNAKAYWEIVDKETGEPTFGKLFGSGLTSGITGSGGHLVLCDDPIAGRAAAESKTIRDNVWSAIADDLLTRLAPVHIVIFLMTTWHWDDPSGRITRAMEDDPDFPQFEELIFPAKAEDYRGPGAYPGKYLFLERYPEQWYKTQRAVLGKYSSAALLDCSPTPRSGGMLSIEFITYVDELPVGTDKVWARVWDLAHTAVQRNGDDPDWTSGTLMSFEMRSGDPVPYLYISDVARTREGAVKRDVMIKGKASHDGPYIRQAIENTIDSKDAYEYVSSAMPEISWTKINAKGDKAARATPLEAIFAAPGHVIVQKAEWNDDWVDEMMKFDGNGQSHDDQVDNLSAGYSILVASVARFDDDTSAALAARRRRPR